MSNIDFIVKAELRNDMGKGASRRLRREGKVPGIIYGGSGNPTNISLDHNALLHQLEQEAFYSHILTIELGGKKEKAVLKDLQRHPAKPVVMHADFQRVSDKDKIKMHVPLHFTNVESSPGVKAGGAFTHNLIEVVVVCMAKDLPEFIEIDMGGAGVDTVIHMSDIKLPKGVELLELMHGAEHNQPVCAIHMPRGAAVEETPAAGTEGA